MTGMDRYDDKRKRAMRRRNHIARDLADRKYRQRVVKNKKSISTSFDGEDWNFLYWDEESYD